MTVLVTKNTANNTIYCVQEPHAFNEMKHSMKLH